MNRLREIKKAFHAERYAKVPPDRREYREFQVGERVLFLNPSDDWKETIFCLESDPENIWVVDERTFTVCATAISTL